MARVNRVAFTQLTSIAGTLTAFQLSGADAMILVNPGALHQMMLLANSSGTTDDLKVTVYTSNADTPGAVPDSGTALAGSDWAVLQEFIRDSSDSDQENIWFSMLISGVRWWAVSVVRNSGSTDTFTVDCNYSDDGVSA